MFSLPAELIHTIIDELADDQKALQACSLTSSTLRGVGQRHIFHALTLDMNGLYASRTDDLSHILKANPQLPTHVCTLKVRVGDLVCQGRKLASTRFSLLRAFPHAHRLVLSSIEGRYTEWWKVPDELKQELFSLLQQPSVVSIALEFQVCFPVEVLDLCRNLKDFALDGTTTLRAGVAQVIGPTSLSRLRSLKTIIYHDNENTLATAQSLVDLSRYTLSHLVLDFWGNQLTPTYERPLISLYGLANLQSLTLVLRIFHNERLLVPFLLTVKTVSAAGSNMRMSIHMGFFLSIQHLERTYWSDLDDVLSKMLDNSVIRRLRVVISTYQPDDTGVATVRQMMWGLESRGYLHTPSASQLPSSSLTG